LVYREVESPDIEQETLDIAAAADMVLVFVGTDQSTGREESDRSPSPCQETKIN